jgi:hypothetical protein
MLKAKPARYTFNLRLEEHHRDGEMFYEFWCTVIDLAVTDIRANGKRAQSARYFFASEHFQELCKYLSLDAAKIRTKMLPAGFLEEQLKKRYAPVVARTDAPLKAAPKITTSDTDRYLSDDCTEDDDDMQIETLLSREHSRLSLLELESYGDVSL